MTIYLCDQHHRCAYFLISYVYLTLSFSVTHSLSFPHSIPPSRSLSLLLNLSVSLTFYLSMSFSSALSLYLYLSLSLSLSHWFSYSVSLPLFVSLFLCLTLCFSPSFSFNPIFMCSKHLMPPNQDLNSLNTHLCYHSLSSSLSVYPFSPPSLQEPV